jgi:hypothetical protein
LVRFLLLPGHAHDMKGVAPLIRDVSFGALMADKAFDANWLLVRLFHRGLSGFGGLKDRAPMFCGTAASAISEPA